MSPRFRFPFRQGLIFGLAAIAGLMLASCLLFKPSAKKLTRQALAAHASYDAVIVPGVPFNAPYWDRVMQMRVIWAVHLYKRGLTRNIIMSGSSVYTPYVEAEVMRLYAIEMGVPPDRIFVEGHAEHSTENLWYGYKLAKSKGFETVAMASDPFQTKLLLRFGKKRLKDLRFLPVIFDTLRTLPHDTPTIGFQVLKVDSFIALPQRQSKWERLRGTRGKHIDFTK